MLSLSGDLRGYATTSRQQLVLASIWLTVPRVLSGPSALSHLSEPLRLSSSWIRRPGMQRW